MKKLSAIVSGLQAIKGEGRWEEIARACDVSYSLIARIAQGRIKSPGIVVCERISASLDSKPARSKPIAAKA